MDYLHNLYKVSNGLSPEFMNHVFPLKDVSLYGSRYPFKTGNAKTVSYGKENTEFSWGRKYGPLVPDKFKKVKSLPEFKRKVKQWKPVKIPMQNLQNVWSWGSLKYVIEICCITLDFFVFWYSSP